MMFNVHISRNTHLHGIPCKDVTDRDFKTAEEAERFARWHVKRAPEKRARIMVASRGKRGWSHFAVVSVDAMGRVWTDLQTAEAGRLL